MSGSAEERAMRDAIIPRLRLLCPGARIIHELVAGDCRADLAAVETDRVTLVEIKSRKDTLERLKRQMEAFKMHGHRVVLLIDQKWISRGDSLREAAGRASIWRYPEPTNLGLYTPGEWRMFFDAQPQPRASCLLQLLWRSELIEECERRGIASGRRDTMNDMIRDMVWLMTGREIAEAVCRQLRKRRFPEADAPILDQIATAA